MLTEESEWIAEKIKQILPLNPYPTINLGSSTAFYRTKTQPFIQKNIFNLFLDECSQVVHVDIKDNEGVDMVGNLYDLNFREKLKNLRPKLILCNNLLMYLDANTRKNLSETLFDILDDGGYLIVTNSYVFPPAHDPVESYYRAPPMKMYNSLFYNFKLLDAQIISTSYSFYHYLISNPKVIFIKTIRIFLPFYKRKEWWFLLKYYFKNLKKDYSATCLFLNK